MKLPDSPKMIAYISLLTAAIALATALLRFPILFGYVHLGDGLIFVAAMIIGPYAALPAALGSAMADAFSGYMIYAPVTFLIKGVMGWAAGYFSVQLRDVKHPYAFLTVVYLMCELWMAFGYLAYDWFLYKEAALGMFPFNLLQGLFGIIIGLIFIKAFHRIRPLENLAEDKD
jgi:uncharacterized membrane protein